MLLLLLRGPLKCHHLYISQLQDQVENLLVSHGDVIALQHDAGPASLIHCQSSPHSLWRQPVLAVNLSEWFRVDDSAGDGPDHLPDPELDAKALVEDARGSWQENVVCPVRLLYVGQSETRLRGAELSAGLPQPGLYDLLVSRACVFLPPCMLLEVTNPISMWVTVQMFFDSR